MKAFMNYNDNYFILEINVNINDMECSLSLYFYEKSILVLSYSDHNN